MTVLGVSTGCYHGMGVVTEDAVDHVRELGADVIEVYLQGACELRTDVIDDIVRRTRLTDQRVLSVHPYVFGWENLLFGTYERQRRWARAHFEEYLEVCVAVGADAYVSHGPPAHHVLEADGSLAPHYVATTRGLVAQAAERGVRYCLENVSYGLLRTPDDLRRHRDAVPDLAYVVDFKSAWKAGFQPAQFLAASTIEAVHHTHVSFRGDDSYGRPVDAAMVGAADPQVLAALRAPIPHVLEIEATSAAQIATSLAALRAALDAESLGPCETG